jgi:hypothetical protein
VEGKRMKGKGRREEERGGEGMGKRGEGKVL